MAIVKVVRPKLALLVLAGTLLVALGAAASAFAATIEVGGPVFQDKCNPCHANISETKNYASEINFTHGYHLRMECSSCHTQFPHSPQGTARPTMQGCWNCHGLKHGPMGELATGKCEDCHRTRVDKLRPAFHTWDWAQKPHVKPSETQLQTKCMMCHDAAWCDDCHEKEFVDWQPKEAYIYDPGTGCQACHANENLLKLSGGASKSFQVTGLDNSAHRKVTCVKCHADFKYETGPDKTKLWSVNAGLSCQECHDHDKQPAKYVDSVHGEKLAAGNLESATCGSCHGGHDIQLLDSTAASEALHAAAFRVCARCHKEQWASYDDYYHGAAYKRGAPDAPACWDCHGAHEVLPSADPKSKVAPARVAETCKKCHKGSDESFADRAGDLIHQKVSAREENPLARFLARVRSWLT